MTKKRKPIIRKKRKTEYSNFMTDQRLAHNKNIPDFADYIGISRAMLLEYETGTCLPSIKTIIMFSKTLGIDPDILFNIVLKERVKSYSDKFIHVLYYYEKTGRVLNRSPLFSYELPRRSCRAKNFGKTLRELRIGKKLSITELGKKCKINKTWLGQIEHGTHLPSLKTLIKIRKVIFFDLKKLYNMLLCDKIEWFTKAYKEYYEECKNGTPLDKKVVKKSQSEMRDIHRYERLKSMVKTATSTYLIDLRKRLGMSRHDFSIYSGINNSVILRIEEGRNLLSFDIIDRLSIISGDSIKKIFHMTLKDRVKLFMYKHIIGFYSFTHGGRNEWSHRKIRFTASSKSVTGEKMQDIAYYGFSSGYLNKIMQDNNMLLNDFSKIAGVPSSNLYNMKNGVTPLNFKTISAMHNLFNIDTDYVLKEVINERLRVNCKFYVKQWKAYLLKRECNDEGSKCSKTDGKQVDKPISCQV